MEYRTLPINSLFVDAACNKQDSLEYRIVDSTGTEIYRSPVFHSTNNNLGEFIALVHAMAYLQQHNLQDWDVYSDSVTALAWVRTARIKSNTIETDETLIELVKRALNWLQTHPYDMAHVKRWDTTKDGDIPADFGRK